MANLNKVMLIGRLTRDPEFRSFPSGGKVAKFGFAVTNRRKNTQTGNWEDEPMFIDVEVYNRGEYGKLADLVERFLHKGSQVFLEGRLHLDQWEDRNGGGKRSKHKLVVEAIQLLDGRPQDGEGGMGRPMSRSAGMVSRGAPPRGGDDYGEPEADEYTERSSGGNDSDIPF